MRRDYDKFVIDWLYESRREKEVVDAVRNLLPKFQKYYSFIKRELDSGSEIEVSICYPSKTPTLVFGLWYDYVGEGFGLNIMDWSDVAERRLVGRVIFPEGRWM